MYRNPEVSSLAAHSVRSSSNIEFFSPSPVVERCSEVASGVRIGSIGVRLSLVTSTEGKTILGVGAGDSCSEDSRRGWVRGLRSLCRTRGESARRHGEARGCQGENRTGPLILLLGRVRSKGVDFLPPPTAHWIRSDRSRRGGSSGLFGSGKP